MIGGVGLLGPLLSVLAHPRWWAMALAAFLVRGGLVVMVLPIVILPTPSGLTNALGPAVTGLALGGAGTDLILLIAGLILGVTATIIIGGTLGAWLEATLVREVAAETAADATSGAARSSDEQPSAGLPGRGAAVHLLSHLPLVLALVWGIPDIVAAGYAELILPDELATPLVVRIVGRVPLTVAAIVAAWVVGEVVGGLALRELVAGRSVPRSLFGAVRLLVRRPPGALVIAVTTHVALLALLVPGLVASGFAWDRVRILLGEGIASIGDSALLAASLIAFVVLWLGAFVLAGLGTALRAVAWAAWWRHATKTRIRDWSGAMDSGTPVIARRTTGQRRWRR